VLAGAFKVFGTSLIVERLAAFAQQVGVVVGVYALARHSGRAVATFSSFISAVLIVPPVGSLIALAWTGGLAVSLFGVLAGLESRRVDGSRARLLALVSGLLFGLALLYRIDLVVAIGLATLAILWGVSGQLKRRLLSGLAIGASPYLIHLATAGVGNAVRGMIIEPVYSRGSALPIPPPPDHFSAYLERFVDLPSLYWPVPTLPGPAQLTVWFFVMLLSVAAILLVGASRLRQAPDDLRVRVLLVVGLFSIGLLPQGLQRASASHFGLASAVSIAFLPIAIVELVRARKRNSRTWTRGVVGGGSVLAMVILVIPLFTARPYVDFTLQTFGRHRVAAFRVEHNGRIFYYGRRDAARAANEMLPVVERISKPGERLFVGPTDLRKTPYDDAYLYYMLPTLTPATYYVEMDPGLANGKDSRLADDLRSADIAILSSVWNGWDEPNDSRKFGPDLPNRVLRTEFCLVRWFGPGRLYEVYRRCDR
jgi:hypothetical protein